MSKGDTQRPMSVDQKTFDNNWDRIFGKKDFQLSQEWVTRVTNSDEEAPCICHKQLPIRKCQKCGHDFDACGDCAP